MTSIEDRLSEICQKINNDGFRVGFCLRGGVEEYDEMNNESRQIRKALSFVKYDHFLYDPYETTNPYMRSTVLYKVQVGLFKAFPVYHNSGLFNRFFMPMDKSDRLSGLVLVSHKLKMLSFVYACNESDDDHLAMWFYTSKLAKWIDSDFAMHDAYPNPIMFPNRMHTAYKAVFSQSYVVIPWEICLSIDDHWKNELLYDKVCMSNDIKLFRMNIDTAKDAINRAEQLIAENNNHIEARMQDFEKYKDQLYASRIEADLQNV